MREGKGVVYIYKYKDRKHQQNVIYIPAEVARDSAFPFKHCERVKVTISQDGLDIRKIGDK